MNNSLQTSREEKPTPSKQVDDVDGDRNDEPTNNAVDDGKAQHSVDASVDDDTPTVSAIAAVTAGLSASPASSQTRPTQAA